MIRCTGLSVLLFITALSGAACAPKQETNGRGKDDRMSRKSLPPRKVVVGTVVEGFKGPYPGLKARLHELAELVDQMAGRAAAEYPDSGLDLVAFPEVALQKGLPRGPLAEKAVRLEGPVLEVMGARARKHRTYIVLPLYLLEGEEGTKRYSNAAALLDRDGKVAGVYRKVHIAGRLIDGEIDLPLEGGATPGRAFPVFECDFGRLGIQICYDMVYEDGWDVLARKGAEIVVWPSAMPNTFRPAARAWRGGYYIVSSTWHSNASVFEPTGMIIAQAKPPERFLVQQIDLSYAIFSWMPKLKGGQLLTDTFGEDVGYRYYGCEATGICWSNDPDRSIGEMIRSVKILEAADKHELNRRHQDAARGGPPEG